MGDYRYCDTTALILNLNKFLVKISHENFLKKQTKMGDYLNSE